MKVFAVLTLLAMFGMSACIRHQESKAPVGASPDRQYAKHSSIMDEFYFQTLERDTLLRRLFDAQYVNSKGIAVWQPNFEDRFRQIASYNGKCYTALDTILYFQQGKSPLAAAIFATYNFDDTSKWQPENCHYCGVPIGIALFEQIQKENAGGKEWSLYAFRKMLTQIGYWGNFKSAEDSTYPISLKWLGDDWPCLSICNPIGGGNSGVFDGDETIYSIVPDHPATILNPVLYYPTYHSQYEDNNNEIEETTTLIIHKQPANYHDVTLRTLTLKGQHEVHYKFNEDAGMYELKHSSKTH